MRRLDARDTNWADRMTAMAMERAGCTSREEAMAAVDQALDAAKAWDAGELPLHEAMAAAPAPVRFLTARFVSPRPPAWHRFMDAVVLVQGFAFDGQGRLYDPKEPQAVGLHHVVRYEDGVRLIRFRATPEYLGQKPEAAKKPWSGWKR